MTTHLQRFFFLLNSLPSKDVYKILVENINTNEIKSKFRKNHHKLFNIIFFFIEKYELKSGGAFIQIFYELLYFVIFYRHLKFI